MNWIRNNRFLASFSGFMIVAMLGLGYFLYSSYASYTEVSDSYDKQATELVRLQSLVPYPDETSIKKYKEQRDLYAKDVLDLRTTLASWNRHLEAITPQQFQEELKESAAAFTTDAGNNGLKLPENFYMGFDDYRDTVPIPEAASPLDRQLKGAEIILRTLIESRATNLISFVRKPLPEESDTGAPPQEKVALVTYFPFDVRFTAGQSEVRRFLNSIVRNKQQFLIIRSVVITNSKVKGPARVAEVPDPSGLIPPDGPAGQTSSGGAGTIQFVLGKEVLSVVIRIEIAEFADPAQGT